MDHGVHAVGGLEDGLHVANVAFDELDAWVLQGFPDVVQAAPLSKMTIFSGA